MFNLSWEDFVYHWREESSVNMISSSNLRKALVFEVYLVGATSMGRKIRRKLISPSEIAYLLRAGLGFFNGF